MTSATLKCGLLTQIPFRILPDVFKFMRANGIGKQVALYYVDTAWTAERRGNFSLRDKAYQKGIDAGAKPLSLLKRRFREFQRRMSRHWLNQDEAARRQEDHHERAIGNDRKPKERKFGGAITRDQAKPGSSRVSRDAPSARPFKLPPTLLMRIIIM